VIALVLFVLFLVGGILGIGRARREFLGTSQPTGDEENPAWLQAVIAEHRAASAKSGSAERAA
jgi:hypothetical protein